MNLYVLMAGWIALGLGAGVFGGLFGIGGGLIMVPALVLVFGFDLKTASGTSLLAQLFPVALLAVLEYWRRGEVHLRAGIGLALGLVVGTLIGALLTARVKPGHLKQFYGVFLIVVGIYFLFFTPAKLAARFGR